MRLRGRDLNSALGRKVAVWSYQDQQVWETFPMLAKLRFDKAYLEFQSKMYAYKPRLQMLGQVESYSCLLPYNIRQIHFGPDKADWPRVILNYDFTPDQICELVQKGLYEPGFSPPDLFEDEETFLEVPVETEVMLLKPESEQDVPLVFLALRKGGMIETDFEQSGYDLSREFQSHTQRKTLEMDYEAMSFDDFEAKMIQWGREAELEAQSQPETLTPEAEQELQEDLSKKDFERTVKLEADAILDRIMKAKSKLISFPGKKGKEEEALEAEPLEAIPKETLDFDEDEETVDDLPLVETRSIKAWDDERKDFLKEEAKKEPKIESKRELKKEPKSETKPKVNVEPKPESKLQPKPEPEDDLTYLREEDLEETLDLDSDFEPDF